MNEHLRRAFERSGKTLRGLADETGIDRRKLGAVLRGERPAGTLTANELLALVGALGLTPPIAGLLGLPVPAYGPVEEDFAHAVSPLPQHFALPPLPPNSKPELYALVRITPATPQRLPDPLPPGWALVAPPANTNALTFYIETGTVVLATTAAPDAVPLFELRAWYPTATLHPWSS